MAPETLHAVYLDYNATAPIRPEAAEALSAALALSGNPSSVHRFGREARRLIEEAREAVAALAGAAAARVVFTSGGTEANNLALRGAGLERTFVSAGEHPSILDAVPSARRVALCSDGRIDLDALDSALGDGTGRALVSVMLANNETGVIQPLRAVAELAHERGALLHCDAVQAAGKIPLDMAELGIDLMSLSAHKLGGPAGVGALLLGEGVTIAPLLRGGGQERRQRAGTENLPGIAGFGAAATAAAERLLEEAPRLGALRDRLEAGVKALAPSAEIFGAAVPRLPNTVCLTMPGVPAETQVMALDLAGVAVSAGSACSSGKVEASHVLRAMGVSDERAATAIRVSLGWRSTAEDVERFLAAWARLYGRKASGREAPDAA